MHQRSFGPPSTPPVIKALLYTIITLSLALSILSPILPYLSYYFGLSLEGIYQGFFWQIITHVLIFPGYELTLGFAVKLFLYAYLFWIFATHIVERKGTTSFLFLFFGATALNSLISLFLLDLTHSKEIFFGSIITLYTILLAYLALNPFSKIFLFFAIPLKTAWLVGVYSGIQIFSFLSLGDWVSLGGFVATAVYTYLFCLFLYGTRSFFKPLEKFEDFVIEYQFRRRNKHPKNKGKKD